MAIEQIKSQAKKVQEDVTTSAHQVFLAGLGAAAVVEEESGKLLADGEKLFDRLVARGKKVETEGRKKIQAQKKQAAVLRRNANATVERLRDGATEQATKLLHRLGVPHQDQIRTLSDRVAELTRKIDALQKTQSAKA